LKIRKEFLKIPKLERRAGFTKTCSLLLANTWLHVFTVSFQHFVQTKHHFPIFAFNQPPLSNILELLNMFFYYPINATISAVLIDIIYDHLAIKIRTMPLQLHILNIIIILISEILV